MMAPRRRLITWGRIRKSLQVLVAYALLFTFTLLVAVKIDHVVTYSWWIIFSPLWLFHGVIARGRFSLPAPSMPHDRHWDPYHTIMATPLLVAFELLLCAHLERPYEVNVNIVFVPLLAFEAAIMIDNLRTCKACLQEVDDDMIEGAIRRNLPNFCTAISMAFFILATVFTLYKICGDEAALSWWGIFKCFGFGEFIALVISTKWHNPRIHENDEITESSSLLIRNQDLGSSLYSQHSRSSNLENIGGHIMKIPIIVFQILLIMRLEGTTASARNMSFQAVFSPLFLLQGAAVLFSADRLVENLVLKLHRGEISARYAAVSSKTHVFFCFMDHGSRWLGWWSMDETSREEKARFYYDGNSKYNSFSPDKVKKMPNEALAKETLRLQTALTEQTNAAKSSHQEYERLLYEKILCRVCFDKQINEILLPCRHHTICSTCRDKCMECPVCRLPIEDIKPLLRNPQLWFLCL